jgi:sulfhydrogenase subunit gamma (sulfur reductase)
MKEPGLIVPDLAEITEVRQETSDIKTFTARYLDREKQERFFFMPGKFLMVSVFGYGEMPISISSSPLKTDSIQLTVRDVGNISHAMHSLEKGDTIGLRGPFGKGFPVQRFRKKNIVFVSGGCGLAPMRSLIFAVAGKRQEFGSLQLLYGCKSPEQILFNDNLKEWEKAGDFKVMLTVDEPAPHWKGHCGLVTGLFEKTEFSPENSVACIVGPPVMIHFAMKGLRERGFREEQIFASLERLMHCGMGKCAHCNVAGKYVCVDGPVFNGVELAKMPLGEK